MSTPDAYIAARKVRVETEAELSWAKTVKSSGHGRMPDDPDSLRQALLAMHEREQELLRESLATETSDASEISMLERARDRLAVAAHLPLAREALAIAQADFAKSERGLRIAMETERLLRSVLERKG